jgi:glycosyltransferase involved in cell wall biosynthesis
MHILQIVSGRGVNGAIIHCLELTKGLLRRGHRVTLACRPNSWIAEQLQDERAEIVVSKLDRFPPRDLRDIARLCRERQVDLVHTHQSRAHFFGVLLRRLFGGPPTVATAHRSLFQPHWPWNDLVIATSAQTAQYHQRWNLVPRHKTAIVRNFIQTEKFRGTPESAGAGVRRELGLAPEDRVIGVVGTVEQRKGLLHLVEALPQVVKSAPHVKVLAAGFQHPAYTARVLARAAALGVRERLLLPGTRSDVPALLRAIDLLAMPSLDESLPLALLEAMSIGLPIVATSVGGIPECLRDGVDGRLVPAANSRALSAALIELLSNLDHARALGQSASERIDREFSPDGQISQIEACFEKLLGHKRVAA